MPEGMPGESRVSGPWLRIFGAVALTAWAVLVVSYRADLGFISDDWTFIINRMHGGADSFLAPHEGHSVALFVAEFRFFLETFGLSNPLPFHLFSTAMYALAASMVFVYLRDLVGDVCAMAGAVLVLFLGASYDDMLWIFQTAFTMAIAAGLLALVLIRVRSLRADIAACVLLTFAIFTETLGLTFLVGAVVCLLVERRDLVRRSFVPLIPIALYAIWYLGWGIDGKTSLNFGDLPDAPLYVFDAFGYSLAVLTGTFRLGGWAGDWVPRLLAVAALAGIGWRAWSRRRIPVELLVGLAAGLTFWGLLALNQVADLRTFDQSRYQLPSAVFTLMILGGGLAGIRPRIKYQVAVVAVAALGVAVNVAALSDGYDDSVKPASDWASVIFTAMDQLGPERIDPELTTSTDQFGLVSIDAATYFELADRFGGAGWSESELADQPDRIQADVESVKRRFAAGQ